MSQYPNSLNKPIYHKKAKIYFMKLPKFLLIGS